MNGSDNIGRNNTSNNRTSFNNPVVQGIEQGFGAGLERNLSRSLQKAFVQFSQFKYAQTLSSIGMGPSHGAAFQALHKQHSVFNKSNISSFMYVGGQQSGFMRNAFIESMNRGGRFLNKNSQLQQQQQVGERYEDYQARTKKERLESSYSKLTMTQKQKLDHDKLNRQAVAQMRKDIETLRKEKGISGKTPLSGMGGDQLHAFGDWRYVWQGLKNLGNLGRNLGGSFISNIKNLGGKGLSSATQMLGGSDKFKKIFDAVGHSIAHQLGGREGSRLFATFKRLGISIVAIIGSLFALKAGIEHATEAYRLAAAQGLSVNTSNSIEGAFKAIGLNTPNLSNITQLLGKGNDADVILNAARAGQFGEEGQQLLNMSKDFRDALYLSTNSMRQMAAAAQSVAIINIQTADIGRQWRTLLAQIAEALQPLIFIVLALVEIFLRLANVLLEVLNFLNPLLQLEKILIPKQNNQNYNLGNITPHGETTSLEKLGFVMNGPSPTKNLADINKNTSGILIGINKLVNIATGAGSAVNQTVLRMPLYP